MAFERGVPGLVVDLVIGMQLCELRFVGRVVEKTANELPESRSLVEPLQTDRVAQLDQYALNLIRKCLGCADQFVFHHRKRSALRKP